MSACAISDEAESEDLSGISAEDASFRYDVDPAASNHLAWWRTRDGGATNVQPVIDLWYDPAVVGISNIGPEGITLISQTTAVDPATGAAVDGGGHLWTHASFSPDGEGFGLERIDIYDWTVYAGTVIVDHNYVGVSYPNSPHAGTMYFGR